ncbi:hypothetical protein A0J61_03115 [Choanephora cucurbitarum]|uniref:Uncharacterized protein n=1 Tax=Choanephora cucurbitarum TaxID=101091 RepID=A0A1C7NJ69_9FUNG|nr:hypothetical protein A0J61_03115 [Choanephora cucurbitarum]
MTEQMSGLYDNIVQLKYKAKEGYHELGRYICIEKLKTFERGPESEVIQMLDILENVTEGLIEEGKAIEEMSELGLYRPVSMVIEVLFRESQFEMKDEEAYVNGTTIETIIDLLMKVMNTELSLSEWKKFNIGEKLGESQQIKNIRNNTAILESIQSMSFGDEDKSNVFVPGMDWLGIVFKHNFSLGH